MKRISITAAAAEMKKGKTKICMAHGIDGWLTEKQLEQTSKWLDLIMSWTEENEVDIDG